MPKYNYKAVDVRGKPVSGRLRAANPEEALAKLAVDGLDARAGDLVELLDHGWFGTRLSAEESAELGGQIAELAKAGLPLAPGLRAMAKELPRRRTSRALRQIAQQLDSGADVSSAISSLDRTLDPHVRGLILAGVGSGRLPEVMEQFVGVERKRLELRRRVALSLAYPALLLSVLLLVFMFFSSWVVPGLHDLFDEFEMDLPVSTVMAMWVAGPGMRVIAAAAVLGAAGFILLVSMRGSARAQWILYSIPVIGPMWRARRLVAFSRLMSLLLDQQIPLPEALRLTAHGLDECDFSVLCRRLAVQVESGRTLSECLPEFRQFPATMWPIVEWGQRVPDLPAALEVAAELFERRLRSLLALWETILPPIVFLIVCGGMLLVIRGTIVPLISLINALT